MFRQTTPYALLNRQAAVFQTSLPKLRDGDEEAVHVARVATRRIRELLPLIDRPNDHDDKHAREFKRIGRALGRVRDADVQCALMRHFEARIPSAAPSLDVFRQDRERERLTLVRSLIKQLEKHGIDRLLGEVRGGAAALRMPRTLTTPAWERRLREAMVDRARSADEAIRHATGIYFPNRAHAVRIALKKLRYAGEIAAETGVWDAGDEIRELKKGQDVLGDLHDRQELIDGLSSCVSLRSLDVDPQQVSLTVHVVEAEAQDLHARYKARREQLAEICARAERLGKPSLPMLVPVLAGSTVAVSSVAWFLRRRFAARQPHPAALEVRERPRAVAENLARLVDSCND